MTELGWKSMGVLELTALASIDPIERARAWKAGVQRSITDDVLRAASTRLDGRRVVIASLDVRDLPNVVSRAGAGTIRGH